MKTKIFLTILYLATLAGYILAQTPGFNYQAVLRDKEGTPMPNSEVTLFISLTKGPAGQVLYKESQILSTNDLGMLNAVIGSGTVVSGSFEDIVGVQNLNIKLEADLPDEPDIVDFGFTPVGSTPFALYGEDADSDPINEMQQLSLEGDSLLISGKKGINIKEIKSPWSVNGTDISYNKGKIVVDSMEFLGNVQNQRSVTNTNQILTNDGNVITRYDEEGNITSISERIGGAWATYKPDNKNSDELKKIREYADRVSAIAIAHILEDKSTEIIIGEEGSVQINTGNGSESAKTTISTLADGSSALTVNDPESNPTTLSGLDGLVAQSAGATPKQVWAILDQGEKMVNCAFESSSVKYDFKGGSSCSMNSGSFECLNSEGQTGTFSPTGICFEGGQCVKTDENLIGVYAGESCGLEIEKTENGVDFGLVCGENTVAGMADIGNGTGGISTATGDVTTWICGSPTPGGTTGFCVALSENQVATVQGATTQNYGEYSCSNPGGFATVRVSGIENFGGVILINDDQGTEKIRLGCDTEGNAGIWFNGSQVLGPPAVAQNRKITDEGSITLINGEATVYCHHEFAKIADPNTMIVHLTPGSAASQGLAVVEKFAGGFKVKELHGGTGNYSVDWQVSSKLKDTHKRSALPQMPDTELIKNNKVVDNLTFFKQGRAR